MRLIHILPRKKKGFTLVELIITIIIVGIISIPLSLMLVQHVEGVFESTEQTVTINLARLEMERLKNMTYANLPVGVSVISNYHGYDWDLTTVINEVNYGPESLATIYVYVLEPGTSNIVATLVSHRARNVIYGT